MKVDELVRNLPADIDGIIIESFENRRYFTGFPSSAGLLFLSKKGSVFLTDFRYIEAAKKTINCCEVTELKKLEDQLPELAKKFDCKKLAFETDRLTVARAKRLSRILGDISLSESGRGARLINGLREIKTKEEDQKVKKAQRIAEKAFEYILTFIKVGKSEKEVALELDYFMLKNGAEALSFDTIVAGGKNSSKPHAVPGDYRLKSGDFITIDFGALYEGYHSDMTRTLALGSVDGKKQEVYQTVLAAQIAGLKALKPALACQAADRVCRYIIEKAGYGENFGHGTGHGVGIEIHEGPTLSPLGKGELKAGHLVTVEPGIYLPGAFGVRIEDMALITEEGAENLTKTHKELLVLDA